MACFRGVTVLLDWSLILAATLALLVPSASALNCVDRFNYTAGTLTGIYDTVEIEITMKEKIPAGEELYTLSWEECVDPPTITDENFNKYFAVDDTEDCAWVVSVGRDLIGVPDYPTPQNTIETTVTFSGFDDASFSNCKVTLRHKIEDENTQVPEPEQSTYALSIKEDLNTGYTIAEFKTSVHDKDGEPQNNKFFANVDDNCPLEPTQDIYTSGQDSTPVEYKLKEPVDYETTQTIECSVTFEDQGSPPLTSSASITISVIDENDEPPIFTFNYYSSELSSVVVPGDALEIHPEKISASDGDKYINSDITYSMSNANPDVDGMEYFTIKKNTGEVTLTKDLDDDFLLNERVIFFVQASDGSLTAPAILEVMLPPAPTTIPSTTPATTCEPCTCPTFSTELVTECPTPTEVTCTPCPSPETTTELVCPTTPTEGTCTPCPTETTVDCTCPDITCPSTPTEGPTHPTVTWDPNLPPLTFKKESYVADIYSSYTTVFAVEVEDIEGYEVTYSLQGDSSQYFSIDANTGMISVNQDNQPPVALHEMEAVATITSTPSQQATTKVTIHVLSLSYNEVAILNSIIKASVAEGEGEQELSSVNLSDVANIVCVTGANPRHLKDHFFVNLDTNNNWKLKKSGVLNYEETKEITVSIRAFTDNAPADCSGFDEEVPNEFLKSEAVAIITVTDINDEAPTFSSDNLVAAHPTNEGLKRVAGPVVSVHANDKDSADVKYSLEGQDAAKFTVDEVTGDVFGVEDMTCDAQCVFTVKAWDGGKGDQVNVTILPLDMGHIFTISMPNTALSEVDEKLNQLSQKAGAQISMLYVSPTETTTRRGRMRHRRETIVSLQVHVYSIKDGALMSRDDLNGALLESSSGFQAEEFIDARVFEGEEPVDTKGLKVAVGVLGGLLGIILLAGLAFVVFQKRNGKTATKTKKSSTPINTLGRAYQNSAYTAENGPSQVNLGSGSVGQKSNGSLNGYTGGSSLNGYTSAEVHIHPDQDSPPLHRSPLARPANSIPLRTRDNQQQSGLKRSSPGTPEFYGSSSPSPPPSYSSSSAPSHPIYAEIKKTKNLSTVAEKNPLPQRRDSTDDEDDLVDNKFSSVKHSPPPRRSTQPNNEDDDEDSDVAYPGGMHDEPAEDEKKSVAFKVKVDTKEIEAENMGPAQKKAEATKLMEANRKKLQEESDDEDEDEEEVVKL